MIADEHLLQIKIGIDVQRTNIRIVISMKLRLIDCWILSSIKLLIFVSKVKQNKNTKEYNVFKNFKKQ